MGHSNDIMAMVDVLKDIADASDTLTVDEGVAVLEALTSLKQAVSQLSSLVDTQMVQILEQPQTRNGKVYFRATKGKWRPDHQQIKRIICERAGVDTSTGELQEREVAVRNAVDLAYEAFVSPASMPKAGLLNKLGVSKDSIADFERTGFEIRVEDTNA